MRQSRTVEVTVAEIQDLRLALQSSKRAGVNDAGVVDIEWATRIS